MSQLFADLGLMPELSRAAGDSGYTQPTPVQVQAIPVILEGCDVLAGAQTGTGKTAGFTLPLLQRLMENPPEPGTYPVRALIVTPTRELAAQIEESVHEYGKYLPLRSTVIFGGVGMGPQLEALKAGVDILVATPGRLLDHANEQTVDLSQVEILVLDEADRMLDMGFIHDVKRILALLPEQRQNLLFSATFSDDIRALADGLLRNPVMVEVARRNAESELVAQRVHPVGQERKRALLAHLVKTGDWKQVLVFTRTKHGANRLAHQLGRSGISATAIHGNKGQGARTKALADFKAGLVRVLVATDIAARGLDIEELPHVVNYDLPHVAEDYVHRIGRTGRAGSTGEAISLVAPEELPLLAEIEKLMKRTVEQTVIPGFEPGSEPPPQHGRGPEQLGQAPRQQGPAEAQPSALPQPPREPRQPQDSTAGERTPKREGEGREGRGRRRGRGRNRQNGENRGEPRDPAVQGATAAPGVAAVDGGAGQIPTPREMREPRAPRVQGEPRGNRGERGERSERGEPNPNRNLHQSRQEAQREDRDNRGNRDTGKNHRAVVLDDDFGNRIQPAKQPRGIRARIAAGDIDEALDNIGNRMPQPPKNQRNLDTEEEINFNVAVAAPQTVYDDDDGQQPPSNAGQLFPSSAGFMGAGRPARAHRGKGRSGRNTGKSNFSANANANANANAARDANGNHGGERGNRDAAGNGASGSNGNNGNARNRGNNKRRRGQPQRAQSGQPGQPGQPQRQQQGQRQRPQQGQSGQPGQPGQQRQQQRRRNAGGGGRRPEGVV